MKKIISLLLVLILSLTMLVACDEEVIGEYDYPDYVPQVVKEIKLNLYIIGGNPDGKAITTVKREITAYTSAQYKVDLDIHYFTEQEYNAAVMADLASADKSVDIVLINSEEMFNTLAAENRLVKLDSYISTTKYGTLNASIAKPLLEAARYGDTEDLLCIPNNRVLGSYTYLCIDRQEGHRQGYSKSDLDNMSPEEAEVLWNKIEASGKNPADYITTITDGKYETKVELEAQGMSCVILEKPQVTKADAYASAFAITTDCDEENYERAMEIIYEINTNVHFRNLLQYGVKNTNYTIDDNNFITFIEGDSSYKMNLLYTGDLFIAYYVDGVYTPDTKKNGEKQNLEASYVPPVMEDTSEGGETPEA